MPRNVKRTNRRKTSSRRRRWTTRARKYSDYKVYSFKRTCELPAWGDSGIFTDNSIYDNSTRNSGYFKFALNDLPGFSDFTTLYEMYKVTGVKLKFIPVAGTQSTLGTASFGSSTPNMNPLAITVDRAYVATTPTFGSLMQHQDVKIRTQQRPFSLWISKPLAYSPADGTTVAHLTNQWLDTTNSGVHHYGLQYAFESNSGSTTNYTSIWRVFATYYIKCRAPQ